MPAEPCFRHFFVLDLIAFCSRLEAASGVISGRFVKPIVSDNCKKFRDPWQTVLEKFHPNLSEAAFSTVFRDNFRPKVVDDVISGMALG